MKRSSNEKERVVVQMHGAALIFLTCLSTGAHAPEDCDRAAMLVKEGRKPRLDPEPTDSKRPEHNLSLREDSERYNFF
ncbi:uncharacterized protein BJ212DRAFT_1350936, partial [Suillus subaureus]